MAGERWLFTQEQLANTPSRKTGIDNDKEIYYRQQAANFVQDMGQRLQVTQLCINTAIVYLHRFYMFHSFSKFHRNTMAEACLFLAAKVEEQPRKLEHIIKMAHMILHRDQGQLDTKSEAYLEHAQELVVNENILLQSLGFELQVDHPHTHIVKTCQLIRAAKDLAQTSYFLATNSLHLTQMCLQHKPTFVACVCIHLACKWAQFEIPRSNEGKEWFSYVDKTMTPEILEDLTQNFLAILDKCPSKFKKKLMSKSAKDEDLVGMMAQASREPPTERKHRSEASTASSSDESKPIVNNHDASAKAKSDLMSPKVKLEKRDSPAVTTKSDAQPKPGTSTSAPDGAMRRVKTETYLTSLTTKEYFEKRERERLERERIEKERQQLIEKEKREKAEAAQRQAEKERVHAEKSSSHPVRQHTNIFEEMASTTVKTEPVASSIDPGTSSVPKENHSTQRSHSKHNYKDKYHEKDTGTRKLPFSVDVSKLRDDQKKPSTYRYPERKTESSRDLSSSSRHGHESKHRSHVPHPDHRASEHKARWSRSAVEEARVKSAPVEPPVTHRPAAEVAPLAVTSKPPVDPEEGEIIDDDSPPAEELKETKKAHSSSSSSHGYHHHHHRERKSSGHRHHSPGAVVPAASLQEPSSANSDKRRRSPRNGRPSKDEPPLSSTEHQEKKSGSVRPEPGLSDIVAPVKSMDVENVLSRSALDGAGVSHRATPEPGEIVERAHKHHHKSSHSKSHKKDKHRDREHPSLSDSTGSLKIKLDLKGVGKIPTPTKHSSPGSSSQHGEDKEKKLKLKIKPLAMMHDIPDLSASGKGSSRETSSSKVKDTAVGSVLPKEPHVKLRDIQSEHRPKDSSSRSKDSASSHREGTPNLKMKLKVPSSSSTIAGNGHTPTLKSEVRGSASDVVQSPGSNPIKLVLSKDSLGQYTPTPTGSSSSSHKHHKHSSGAIDKSSSRKRPFSPSESSTHRHKLPRNDSSSSLSRGGTNNMGDRSGASSATGSPFPGADGIMGKQAAIQQSLGLLQQLIDKTQEQISQRRPGNPTPPSDAGPDL